MKVAEAGRKFTPAARLCERGDEFVTPASQGHAVIAVVVALSQHHFALTGDRVSCCFILSTVRSLMLVPHQLREGAGDCHVVVGKHKTELAF